MSPSSIETDITETRRVLGLDVGIGTIVGHLDDNGKPIPCIVGPDESAPEVYEVARCDAKTGRYRDDVAMLGFSGPALARAVFFALASSPKEYRQLDTWVADRWLAWLEKEPSDSPFDDDEGADDN